MRSVARHFLHPEHPRVPLDSPCIALQPRSAWDGTHSAWFQPLPSLGWFQHSPPLDGRDGPRFPWERRNSQVGLGGRDRLVPDTSRRHGRPCLRFERILARRRRAFGVEGGTDASRGRCRSRTWTTETRCETCQTETSVRGTRSKWS